MKNKSTALLTAAILFAGTTPSRATIPVIVAADPYEIAHMLSNYLQFYLDKLEQVKQLTELLTANEYSETLEEITGTYDSLQNCWEEPTRISSDLQGMAGGIMGMFDTSSWLGDVEQEFDPSMDSLQNLSLAQMGNENADTSYMDENGGAYGLSNRIGGMRTALATSYLQGGKKRKEQMAAWQPEDYGNDAITMQKSQLEIAKASLEAQQHAAEERALATGHEAAKATTKAELDNARSAALFTRNSSFYHEQID